MNSTEQHKLVKGEERWCVVRVQVSLSFSVNRLAERCSKR